MQYRIWVSNIRHKSTDEQKRETRFVLLFARKMGHMMITLEMKNSSRLEKECQKTVIKILAHRAIVCLSTRLTRRFQYSSLIGS
ncbi:hypothetical protein C9J85_12190 [Haloferax sp. wsp5]|nr:hypothetical protein C9J85_12190 [Haloferax sp. wsp5]